MRVARARRARRSALVRGPGHRCRDSEAPAPPPASALDPLPCSSWVPPTATPRSAPLSVCRARRWVAVRGPARTSARTGLPDTRADELLIRSGGPRTARTGAGLPDTRVDELLIRSGGPRTSADRTAGHAGQQTAHTIGWAADQRGPACRTRGSTNRSRYDRVGRGPARTGLPDTRADEPLVRSGGPRTSADRTAGHAGRRTARTIGWAADQRGPRWWGLKSRPR